MQDGVTQYDVKTQTYLFGDVLDKKSDEPERDNRLRHKRSKKRKHTRRSLWMFPSTVVGRGLQVARRPKRDAHPGVGLRMGRGTSNKFVDRRHGHDRRAKRSGVEDGHRWVVLSVEDAVFPFGILIMLCSVLSFIFIYFPSVFSPRLNYATLSSVPNGQNAQNLPTGRCGLGVPGVSWGVLVVLDCWSVGSLAVLEVLEVLEIVGTQVSEKLVPTKAMWCMVHPRENGT